jgi:hypothetical protein
MRRWLLLRKVVGGIGYLALVVTAIPAVLAANLRIDSGLSPLFVLAVNGHQKT